MAYWRECPLCGDHLDPGERCDCQDKKKAAQELDPPKAARTNNALSFYVMVGRMSRCEG